MNLNVLLVGVGGQGILTIAHMISAAAIRRGFCVKQSEVHGMSQRGGAVQAHLRFSDQPIHSDLIPLAGADIIIAVEPLEVLRYTEYLHERSVIVSSTAPFTNIADYPPIGNVLDRVARLGNHVLIDAPRLAKIAGSVRAENMVMLGAAVRFMDFGIGDIERIVQESFTAKGERVAAVNRRGLYLGYHAAGVFRDTMRRGFTSRAVQEWMKAFTPDQLANWASTDGNIESFEGPLSEITEGVKAEIGELLATVRSQGREQLFEHEVYRLVELAGAINPPRHWFVPSSVGLSDDDLSLFSGDMIVLKVVSPDIVHKSDARAIAVVQREPATIRTEIARLVREQSSLGARISGVLLVEWVEQVRSGLGGELFVGVRNTREFGAVIAAGLGGVDTEFLSTKMRPGVAIAKASAMDTSPEEFFRLFQMTAAYELLSGHIRGHERIVEDGELLRCFAAFIAIARQFAATSHGDTCIEELEVNPFAFRRRSLVPLDGRGRLGKPIGRVHPRPLEKVARLLEPQSIAVIGVSGQRENFGRIILNNICDCGFPKEHLYVIKSGCTSVDGIRCISTLAEVPESIDLLVAATSAQHVPGLVDEVIACGTSERTVASVILIPGGLGEKEGTGEVQTHLRETIHQARAGWDAAPVFLGGNCMGVRSRPGRYDTFFIPRSKLDPRRDVPPKRFALISQSGAFIITRMSNLEFLEPRFAISVGNQVDLTVSDVLYALAQRDDLDCIGVYVEGFNDLDGLEFLRAVESATRLGKLVVFYKAGRTSAGRSAAQGHTASVAGDYDVCQAAVAAAGAMVVDTFKEFEQLVELGTDLHAKRVGGVRLGLISNAGYETVGMADTIRGPRYDVEVARLSENTVQRLRAVLDEHGLGTLVDAKNPLDLTPMAGDAAYEDCVRAMLDDGGVDGVIVGCVPMTPRLLTTPEELQQPGSIAQRIAELFRESTKPLAFVVDCLAPYDALARAVRSQGVPVFRTADQAVRSVGRYLAHRAQRCSTTPMQVRSIERIEQDRLEEAQPQEVGS